MEKVLDKANIFADKCIHNRYLIDTKKNYVECSICGDHLNPMWVLEQLCYEEARVWKNLDFLKKRVEKTKDKLRCKCQHCQKMTRIER